MIADDFQQWLAHHLNQHPITTWWVISLLYIATVVGVR